MADGSVSRALQIEGDAARVLLMNLRSLIDGDEAMTADAVEGETRLFEVIDRALERLAEIETMEEAIGAHVKAMSERKARLSDQSEVIRAALLVAMGQADLKKIERPLGTISRKPVPAKVVITNDAEVPPNFWKPQPPKLDLKGIGEALKDKREVPGATLSNGSETISIRKV